MHASIRTLESANHSSKGRLSKNKKKLVVDELGQHELKLSSLRDKNSHMEQLMKKFEEELQQCTEQLTKLQQQNHQECELMERQLRAYRTTSKNKRLNQEYVAELQGLLQAEATYKSVSPPVPD